MMDLKCVKCGEPWSIDSLHDEASTDGVSFDEKRDEFYTLGCEALGTGHGNGGYNEVMAMAIDIMGDDVDGIASMLDDAEWLGF